jgi:tRNA uridine 5-carbamoylmethylation protein Kti12
MRDLLVSKFLLSRSTCTDVHTHTRTRVPYTAEKNTRGLLKSTVDRLLYKDGPVVILDSGNHIKGYRYELWCIARQARVCL